MKFVDGSTLEGLIANNIESAYSQGVAKYGENSLKPNMSKTKMEVNLPGKGVISVKGEVIEHADHFRFLGITTK